jgi:hypothetical protein
MFRRRRPGLRLAAGAATAGAAYHAGKRHADEEAAGAQAAPYPSEEPSEEPPPAPAGSSNVDDLNRLAELHSSGALSDDEFAQAKASLLGMDAP